MLPRKIFENLHALIAFLMFFKQFLRKFCLNFLTLIQSALPNTMHFVRTLSIMRAKAYLYCKSLKLWKNCTHQKHL